MSTLAHPRNEAQYSSVVEALWFLGILAIGFVSILLGAELLR